MNVLRILRKAHADGDGLHRGPSSGGDVWPEAVNLGRSRMRTRNWSIRSKIITMVTVPLTALLAVWLFATALTADPALTLLSARTLATDVATPGEVVITELQRERRLSVQFLSDTSASTGMLTA